MYDLDIYMQIIIILIIVFAAQPFSVILMDRLTPRLCYQCWGSYFLKVIYYSYKLHVE